MDYGSSLREKEDNFDNLCCESSHPTVAIARVRLTRFLDNVETKMNLQASHRATVAFTKRENPGLFESSSGGSSNPMSIHRRTKSNVRRRFLSRGQNLDYDSRMTYVEKTFFQNAHLRSTSASTP